MVALNKGKQLNSIFYVVAKIDMLPMSSTFLTINIQLLHTIKQELSVAQCIQWYSIYCIIKTEYQKEHNFSANCETVKSNP